MRYPLLQIGAGLIALGMIGAFLWGPKSAARNASDLAGLIPYAVLQGIGWLLVVVHYATHKKTAPSTARPKPIWQLDVKRLSVVGWLLAVASSLVGVGVMFAGMKLTADLRLPPPLVLGTMLGGLFLGFASALLIGNAILSTFGFVVLKSET